MGVEPTGRTDGLGRPCVVKVEMVDKVRGGWIGHVMTGPVIAKSTRLAWSAEAARHSAERWLTLYLETQSWNKATELWESR